MAACLLGRLEQRLRHCCDGPHRGVQDQLGVSADRYSASCWQRRGSNSPLEAFPVYSSLLLATRVRLISRKRHLYWAAP